MNAQAAFFLACQLDPEPFFVCYHTLTLRCSLAVAFLHLPFGADLSNRSSSATFTSVTPHSRS